MITNITDKERELQAKLKQYEAVMRQAMGALGVGLDYVRGEQFENAQRFKGYMHLAPDDESCVKQIEESITALREVLGDVPESSFGNMEQPEVWVTPKLCPLAKLAKELDGVIADVEQGDGFDDVCLDTVKYVRDELAEQPTQQEPLTDDQKDAARYRAFLDSGFPVCFMGVDCFNKSELDSEIDKYIAEADHGIKL